MPTLWIALAALLWGTDLLFRPLLLNGGWGAARLVLWEHLILTGIFAGALWAGRGQLAGLTRAQWGCLLFVSWGGSALATWLYTVSFSLGSPLPAILLQKTQPVFALLLAGRLLGERRAPKFWLWCAAAIAGALLLTGVRILPTTHGGGWLDAPNWKQSACALTAAALWGGATVAGRALGGSLAPAVLAGARFALAVPVLALLACVSPTLSGLAGAAHQITPLHSLSLLLLIVLLPDLLGMRLYYAGLRDTPASVATLAELCYPLTALLIGLVFQHATLLPGQWAGLILLLGSVLRLGRNPDTAAPNLTGTTIPALPVGIL